MHPLSQVQFTAKADCTEEYSLRVIPEVGYIYKTKYISIMITHRNKDGYKAKVLSTINNRRIVGEILEIDNIAFCSSHYKFVRYD